MPKFFLLKRLLVLTVILWVVSWLFSWPAGRQWDTAINDYAGSSMLPERMAGRLDLLFLTDFVQNQAPRLSQLPALLPPLLIIYLLLQIAFTGGIMSAFRSKEPVCPVFFRQSAVLAPKFLVIFLLSLLVYGFCAVLPAGISLLAGAMLIESNQETALIYVLLGGMIVTGAGVAAAQTFTNIVRASVVAGAGLGEGLRSPFRLGWRHFLRLYGWTCLFLAAGLLLVPGLAGLGLLSYRYGVLLWLLLQLSVFLHLGLKAGLSGLFALRHPAPAVSSDAVAGEPEGRLEEQITTGLSAGTGPEVARPAGGIVTETEMDHDQGVPPDEGPAGGWYGPVSEDGAEEGDCPRPRSGPAALSQ